LAGGEGVSGARNWEFQVGEEEHNHAWWCGRASLWLRSYCQHVIAHSCNEKKQGMI
jgi:hypothetical protein